MQGWLYRFNDGPLKGVTFGPSNHVPPESLTVYTGTPTPAFVDTEKLTEEERKKYGDDLCDYRRIKMSSLDEDVPESIARGAEYELVVSE
jgi:hypothetical protein